MSYSVNLNKTIESEVAPESRFLTPFQYKVLIKNLPADIKSKYRRQIEIMLLADRGKSQTHICKILSCSQKVARYWIAVAVGLAHKWNERSIDRPKTANHQYLKRLKELVNHSLHDYGYTFSSWTTKFFRKHLEISDRHNLLLKQMGLSGICN